MRKQKVFVSQGLVSSSFGKPVFSQLQNILGDRLNVLPISNVWCRDYMPVKGAKGKHVLFKYAPSYLIGEKTYEKTIPDNLSEALDKERIPFETCEVVLDGGGIVMRGDTAIVTDRVISENSSEWRNGKPVILETIQKKLELKRLVVVPADPFDITGHADGTVRFIDDETVLVNDPTDMFQLLKHGDSIAQLEMYERWIRHFENTLKDVGFRIEYLPCLSHEEDEKRPNSAWGIYLNFLELGNMILVPFFEDKDETNENVKLKLEQFYNRPVHGVYADELSEWGGIINCCTWQICV
ncbi:MAG: agmatine deiminase family protein [Flavobacteriales bacterium]|nr:agmatine deiminase family protein [Flavobacteriales bacterium]